MEYGTDVESADSEIGRAWVKFNITGKKKEGNMKRTSEAQSTTASEQKESSRRGVGKVSVFLTCR